MRACIVTDEISADPETAIELGVEWGIRDFEIRGFGTNRVPLFTPYQKDRLYEILDAYDARVVAISPGLFKCFYPIGGREQFPLRTFDYDLHDRWRRARERVKYELEELLPMSIEYGKEIGATLIVVFSFHRGSKQPGQAPDEVLSALRLAAEKAHEAGMRLVVEVEDGFWADTGARTAEMIGAIDHPALGVNWDPGNAFVAGDTPYPDGYQAVRSYVQHVHFKDVTFASNGAFSYAIAGEIDWAEQIHALAKDGYVGHISVETHMQPKVQSARAMTERLQRLIGAAGGP